MKNWLPILLALSLPLAGCATGLEVDPQEGKITQAQMTPTVASFDEMTFEPLAEHAVASSQIKSTDPIYDFGETGPSFFRAVELPTESQPYYLEVRSDPFLFGCYPCSSGIFFPEFLFLDADKHPLATQPASERFYRNVNDYIGMTRWAEVSPEIGARYVVIYTTKKWLDDGEWIAIGQSGVASAGGLFLPVPAPRAHKTGRAVGYLAIDKSATRPTPPADFNARPLAD